jgi:hypothetical protein
VILDELVSGIPTNSFAAHDTPHAAPLHETLRSLQEICRFSASGNAFPPFKLIGNEEIA